MSGLTKAALLIISAAILLPAAMRAQSDPLAGEVQWIDLEIDGNIANPCCINNAGQVAGQYAVNGAVHNFLRNTDGTYLTYDIPGAFSTEIDAINASGAIAGWYSGPNGQNYTFVRNPDGSLITFQPPETCAGSCDPRPVALTDSGVVIGAVILGTLDYSIFVRHSDGNIQAWDPNLLFGTLAAVPQSANNSGVIAGTTGDDFLYAFLLKPSGEIATLERYYEDLGIETYNVRINQSNIISGYYNVAATMTQEAFVKQPGGPLIGFGYPGALFTTPSAINSGGVIAGTYQSDGPQYGFLRNLRGGIVSVNFPDSYTTSITGINDNGWLIGQYSYNAEGVHAFLRIPGRQP